MMEKTYLVTVQAIIKADNDDEASNSVLAHGVPCFTDYEVIRVQEAISVERVFDAPSLVK